MEHAIWGGERHRMAERLDAERAADPDGITILVVEAGGEVVCGCWVRFEPAAGFATLWGGATLPGWRGRGIYRAAVALPRQSGRRARPSVRPGGRIGREPPDPRAARFHGRDENDAVHLVAAATYGLTML